jgi:hypothetical protein
MGEAGPAAGHARPFRLASPVTAAALAILTLALTVLYVPLAWPAHDLADGWQVLMGFLAFAVPGAVVARRQPGNPIGWLLLGLGVYAGVITDVGRYAVLDYHFHHGSLPFGPAAALLETGLWTATFLALPLVILLFPDGRLPRGWRPVLWLYLADAGLVAAYFLGAAAWAMSRQPVAVNGAGQLIKQPSPPVVTAVAVVLIAALPVCWVLFVIRQVLSWRRAAGDRRQQLKWLMSGAAITVAGLAGIFGFASVPSLLALEIVSFFASFALPVAISVAILKYRLYEIDRIISRTLAYAIVTGLLVGVYASLVLLATRVLPLSSPVAVAASTLAVAALFSPVRRRVQRIVDRRFNRARYDADKALAVFAARLQDAVDLDSVRGDLASAVHQALEPTRVSVWVRQHE